MKKQSLLEIFLASLKLGLTSFGGPVAHLGYFKDEYIDKRKWLDDRTYADVIALCQFLPGPASSQVGMAIGMLRGGLAGGILSWIGFTLPSVLVLVLFAFVYQSYTLGDATWISSLKIVAVAVVAHALIGLGKKLTPDRPRLAIALTSALAMLLFASAWLQIVVIIVAGIIGYILFVGKEQEANIQFHVPFSKKHGIFALILFTILIIGLPIGALLLNSQSLNLMDTFYRVGSLVFGGGHVVLPLLEREVVPDLITSGEFLAGYGMAQAVPGPLFTFASYLGAMINGIPGAILATIAIFLPSFLLVIGTLPFLQELRTRPRFQGILTGVNASVVGILLAAFYDPVFTSSIFSGADFALALILFFLLNVWKLPAWFIVILGIVFGEVLTYV